jgi:hypothetical protein
MLCEALLKRSLHVVLELPSLLPSQLLHDVAYLLRQRDELFRARLYAFVKSLLSFLSRDQARLD